MPTTHLLLAPGASGSIERLTAHRSGLEARGLTVSLVELPRGRAERAIPVYATALAAAGSGVAIGGHSFGGRVASLLAADAEITGLVLMSYPLHAPGRHEAWDERTRHWPRIRCSVLLLSGESDPFARLDLLRSAVRRLPNAKLVTFPGVGHGLDKVLDAALDQVAAFLHSP
ncbi:hypothetical protein BH23CHL10_BH23CHL10_12900 [soil metagenome]